MTIRHFAGNPRPVKAKAHLVIQGSALSRQCSKMGENRVSDSPRDSGERIPSSCVINGMVTESQGVDVSCVAIRKILEKLKSICPSRRLHVAPMEEAGETASSTWDQVRALSTENEAGALGISDSTWQDGSGGARQSWHDEGRPDSCASFVEDEERVEEEAREHVHFRQDRPEALDLRLVRRCWRPRNCIPPGGPCSIQPTRVSRQRCRALLS